MRNMYPGKWHLSYIDDSTYTYDDAANTVKQCGFDTVGGLYIENLKSSDNFNNYHDGSFSHNMEWITHEAIKVIEDDSTEPFFMYFNPTVPHLSNSISSALSDFSCRDTAAGTLDEDPVIPGMTDDGCASYRQTIFDRAEGDKDLGAIWIDDSVGALLTSLEGAGKLDDTIFLFQADHGINPKGALYEGAVRIPQFIHYPSGISAGAQFDLPVSVIDVGVTMLNFSGITPSYEMDGRSWKEAVSNENFRTGWVDRCLYFEVERDRAVRCGCYKYLDIFDEEESTTLIRGVRMGLSHDERNLFDLCGGSVDLATDIEGKNMEVENLIDQETSMGSNFETLLECHLERIEAADFSQCQLSRPVSGDVAGTPDPPTVTAQAPTTADLSASPTNIIISTQSPVTLDPSANPTMSPALMKSGKPSSTPSEAPLTLDPSIVPTQSPVTSDPLVNPTMSPALMESGKQSSIAPDSPVILVKSPSANPTETSSSPSKGPITIAPSQKTSEQSPSPRPTSSPTTPKAQVSEGVPMLKPTKSPTIPSNESMQQSVRNPTIPSNESTQQSISNSCLVAMLLAGVYSLVA